MNSTVLKSFIPGYTGQIPSEFSDRSHPLIKSVTEGHIPGYAGFVPKIKQDNYFGKSFGVITTQISQNQIPISEKYITMNQFAFVDQNKVRLKIASEILKVQLPLIPFIQPTEYKLNKLNDTVGKIGTRENEEIKNSKVDSQNIRPLISNVDFIHTSLPGYTGHTRKVDSSNIYGMSFKRAQEESIRLLNIDQMESRSKIKEQCEKVPGLVISTR